MNFDEAYYERGLETGVSCYQNYRWIPELTIPMAMTLIDFLGIKRFQRVLDFGCSKGFLVKAFRMLYRDAYGVDISEYAIRNTDPSVSEYCYEVPLWNSEMKEMGIDITIAKDVFEHIPPPDLTNTLCWMKGVSKKLFVIVPLGVHGKGFNASKNDLDKTHVICENASWWIDLFEGNKWEVVDFRTRLEGIKDSYESIPKAHGFFKLRSEKD